MLVLGRKQKQAIVFPALAIRVSVETIAPNSVRLGIIAPKNISIMREEIVLANEAALAAAEAAEAATQPVDESQLMYVDIPLAQLSEVVTIDLTTGSVEESVGSGESL